MVKLSHPYMTTGKTIALIIQSFIGKVISLLFYLLSIFFIIFSFKEQASFNFMAAVTIHSDSGTQENKICHCFHSSLPICHEEIFLKDKVLFWQNHNTTLKINIKYQVFKFLIISYLYFYIIYLNSDPNKFHIL